MKVRPKTSGLLELTTGSAHCNESHHQGIWCGLDLRRSILTTYGIFRSLLAIVTIFMVPFAGCGAAPESSGSLTDGGSTNDAPAGDDTNTIEEGDLLGFGDIVADSILDSEVATNQIDGKSDGKGDEGAETGVEGGLGDEGDAKFDVDEGSRDSRIMDIAVPRDGAERNGQEDVDHAVDGQPFEDTGNKRDTEDERRVEDGTVDVDAGCPEDTTCDSVDPAQAEFGDAFRTLCSIWGSSGSEVCCPLQIANATPPYLVYTVSPHLRYSSGTLALTGFLPAPCGPGSEDICLNATAMTDTFELATGHTVAVGPEPPNLWDGDVLMIVAHLNPIGPPVISSALWMDGVVEGQATFACAKFVLKEDISQSSPARVAVAIPIWGGDAGDIHFGQVFSGVMVFSVQD